MIDFKPVPFLDIDDAIWKKALEKVEPDNVVGILHASLTGDENCRSHVAQIPEKVGAHVHFIGDESYSVVAGEGLLHYGLTNENGNVEWETPLPVSTGQSFVIPEGCAHQLEKKGGEDLVILFSCPDSHLNDTLDRMMLENSPFLGNKD